MRVIETEALSKTYRRPVREPGFGGAVRGLFHRMHEEKEALKAFDLKVAPGERVGLIGPNGAGKTTLVKMLCGIVQPTSGKVAVLGYRPGDLKDDFRRRYAVVMGQKSQLWWDLPAIDTFRLNREIYGIPEEKYQRNLKEYTDLFDVAELLRAPVRNLSLGERMKMELMAAMMHDPELVFLDEPTIGLDAIAQKSIRRFLREVNERRGVTVLLTSHYMEDIRHLCPRTLVINEGRKVYDGALDTLMTRYQTHQDIRILLAEPIGDTLSWPEAVEVLTREPYRLHLRVPRRLVRAQLAGLLAQHDIEDIRIEDEEVGNVIERIYQSGREVLA